MDNFVSTHLGVIGIVIIVGCIVVLLMILMLFIQSRRIELLSERLDYLTQGADGESLEGVLDTHLATVVRVANEVDQVAARTAILEGAARLHFGRLGIVRFNPFRGDTGGDQSFALAILDSNNDGFVITSLHSRTGTRLYAKAIFGAESEATLGPEEAQAVEIAASQGGGAPTSRATKAAAGKSAGRAKAAGSGGGPSKPGRQVKQVAAQDAPDGVEPAGLESANAGDTQPDDAEPEPAAAASGSITPPA